MKEVVDQSKFVLHKVELEFLNFQSLEMSFEKRDGDTILHQIIMEIGNADLMDKTAKWMATILKNAEIEYFKILADDILIGDFIEKMKENSKSPLKAGKICCHPEVDPFCIFDKSYCQRLTCWHDDPNFFRKYKEILMNLDEVELMETMNITDEDVLSMKATQIHLKSENFSAEMVNTLVEKFIARGLIDSYFYIENPKGNFIPEIKIPDGFIASTELEGWHKKIDGDKRMILWVLNDSVSLEIDPRSRSGSDDESDDDSSDSDSDSEDDSDEEDDEENDSDDDDDVCTMVPGRQLSNRAPSHISRRRHWHSANF